MNDVAPLSGRDGQLRSPFGHILARLCASCVGIEGAGIVDDEGETVDIAIVRPEAGTQGTARLDAYAIKLAGACFQVCLRQANCDDPELLTRLEVKTAAHSYLVAPLGGGFLSGGYMLLVICAVGASCRVSQRALREAVVGIAQEAGWDIPVPAKPRWRRVQVRTLLGGAPCQVDDLPVVGAVQTATEVTGFARGYRVDVGGVLSLLIREPSGHWYLEAQPPSIDG